MNETNTTKLHYSKIRAYYGGTVAIIDNGRHKIELTSEGEDIKADDILNIIRQCHSCDTDLLGKLAGSKLFIDDKALYCSSTLTPIDIDDSSYTYYIVESVADEQYPVIYQDSLFKPKDIYMYVPIRRKTC